MMLWKVVLTFLAALLSLFQLYLGLRICPNHALPAQAEIPFRFCTDYSHSAACLAPNDSHMPARLYPSELIVARAFDKIHFQGDTPTNDCANLVQKLFCAAADPWSSTLYREKSLVPAICPSLSATIWDQCAFVVMAPNPFSKHYAKASLQSLFKNRNAFEEAFSAEDHGHHHSNCYNGVPVDATKPLPELPTPGSKYAGQACLQRINFQVGDKQILVGGAPYPTDSNLMAIIDKAGVISLWDMSKPAIQPVTLLDLSSEIVSNDANGLLSIVFHKQFAKNGRLFLSMTCQRSSYQCKKDGDLVIDEYVVADPDKASTPEFARRILYVDRVFGDNIGGQLLFSPSSNEPNLFVFLGDGGAPEDGAGDPFNNGQSLLTLPGKVLRLDIDNLQADGASGIPQDNPFVGLLGVRHEIYAYGLRNPWRCSFDRRHGEFLFCGDVGDKTREEVDRIIAGGNYGWSVFEGRAVHNTSKNLGRPPIVFPQIEFSRATPETPISVIGGYVYRPDQKTSIDGTYFYADEFGKIYSAIAVPGSGVYHGTPKAGDWECASDSPVACGKDLGLIFSFFETGTGDVYFISSKGIFKIVEPSKCPYLD